MAAGTVATMFLSSKFFNPLGVGIRLATELDVDADTLFGLADLGEPELGRVCHPRS